MADTVDLLNQRSDQSFIGGGAAGRINWGNLAGAVAPFALSLFGSNPAKEKTTGLADTLKSLGTEQLREGRATSGKGTDALAPVLKLLMQLVGGDSGALAEATAPERARVLDQYDTVRERTEFAPRGGGQASSAARVNASEAHDLAVLPWEARTKARGELGALGFDLQSLGTRQEQAGAQDLSMAFQAFEQLSRDQGFSLGALGAVIGEALPIILAAIP